MGLDGQSVKNVFPNYYILWENVSLLTWQQSGLLLADSIVGSRLLQEAVARDQSQLANWPQIAGPASLNNPHLMRHRTQGDPTQTKSVSDEYWVITEFLALTAEQLQALKYWEKSFTFPDFKRNCHSITSAWYIRRHTNEQIGYAGNGPTLNCIEIWSPAAAARLGLNLAVVPLHEEYKPFIAPARFIDPLVC